MTRAERLRVAAEGLAAALVQVLEALATNEAAEANLSAPAHDLTVTEMAVRFHRSPSTVRGWLEHGRFPGAYKLNGRDWRVPLDGVAAFEQQQGRHSTTPVVTTHEPMQPADLSAWRAVRGRQRGAV